MYTGIMKESAEKVAAKRKENAAFDPRRMSAEEKEAVLREYHPDHITEQFTELTIGPNKGEKAPLELAEILQGMPRIEPEKIDLTKADYETDVLIIGGGGAGTAAAIEADNAGAQCFGQVFYSVCCFFRVAFYEAWNGSEVDVPLFGERLQGIEYAIPRSYSLENSDGNRTGCMQEEFPVPPFADGWQ